MLFQSTHPSGVRLDDETTEERDTAISIHAPQWGATGKMWARPFRRHNFNPRTPVGCDKVEIKTCPII